VTGVENGKSSAVEREERDADSIVAVDAQAADRRRLTDDRSAFFGIKAGAAGNDAVALAAGRTDAGVNSLIAGDATLT